MIITLQNDAGFAVNYAWWASGTNYSPNTIYCCVFLLSMTIFANTQVFCAWDYFQIMCSVARFSASVTCDDYKCQLFSLLTANE